MHGTIVNDRQHRHSERRTASVPPVRDAHRSIAGAGDAALAGLRLTLPYDNISRQIHAAAGKGGRVEVFPWADYALIPGEPIRVTEKGWSSWSEYPFWNMSIMAYDIRDAHSLWAVGWGGRVYEMKR